MRGKTQGEGGETSIERGQSLPGEIDQDVGAAFDHSRQVRLQEETSK